MAEENEVPNGIESYELAEVDEAEAESRVRAVGIRPVLRMTIHGPGFPVSSVDPVVTVGGRSLVDIAIAEDARSVVAYLDEIPQEGAPISLRYGDGPRAVSPEPFTITRLGGPPPVA